jgi:hypothetical protein
MNNLTASFDYDGSLDSNPMILRLCQSFITAGAEVFILTNRFEDQGSVVRDLGRSLGLKEHHILFAGGTSKAALIKKYSIDVHFDDDETEVHQINYECGPIACLINYQMRTGDELI